MNLENSNVQGRANKSRVQQNKKDKVKVSFAIKPEHFETKKGIRSLYQKTKSLKLDQFSEINVQNTMKKIVTVLKSWQNDFVPKYSFDYFLQRCQTLGNHKLVTAYMSKVRKIHKGLQQWENSQPNQVQAHQENQNNPVHDNFEQNINILNGIDVPEPYRHNEEEDEDIFELMEMAEKKAENKRENKMEQAYVSYVPEGYQNPFSQQDD